jgi:signal transduction histidine kinase
MLTGRTFYYTSFNSRFRSTSGNEIGKNTKLSKELQVDDDNSTTDSSMRRRRREHETVKEEAEADRADSVETTEFITDPGAIIRRVLQLLSGATSKLDGVGDKDAPVLIVNFELYWKALADIAHLAGEGASIRTRYITDITRQNLDACKKLMDELHVSLRHLEGVKSSFVISEREFAVDLSLPHPTLPATRLLYSNSKELLEQEAQLFETLWSKAIPASQRIKEIEEGRPRYETRVLRDPYEILQETRRMVATSRRYSVSSVGGGLLYAYNRVLDQFELVMERARRRAHEGVRWVTKIDRDSIEIVRRFLDLGVSIRHVERAPTESFGFSDKEVGVTVSRLEGGSLSSSALFSDDPMYVDHYASVFEDMWTNGIDAREKIKEIEEGIEEPKMMILRNPKHTESLFLELTNSAKSEILLIMPTTKSYGRDAKIGVVDALKAAAARRGVKVSILSPGIVAREDIQDFNHEHEEGQPANPIRFKSIPEAKGQSTVTVLVVDRTRSLIVELQDDSKEDFSEAIGVATYSTRGSTVKANIRFFERMWEEESILERERRSRKEAELLQDILAHDLRNFNQIVKISAELLQSADENGLSNPERTTLLNNILKAVDRASGLIERAKMLGRLVSQEQFDLHPLDLRDTMVKSMDVITKAHAQRTIRPVYSISDDPHVLADGFLEEVFTNILSNAVKYTARDPVSIEIKVERERGSGGGRARRKEGGEEAAAQGDGELSHNYWKISVTDEGKGIPDELKTKVFTRYLDSAHGSGLGLSIVYALVVERYSGRIRVVDRVRGDHTKGTTVEVWLPDTN